MARGVDVKVLVPGEHVDIPAIRMASRYHYGELLDGGVQIYEYLPTMMHNKVMVVDGIWSTVGSINFDNRSMRKNAEANVAIYDHGFAAGVEKMIETDLLSSERFTKEKWKKRGLPARFGELFFWLFSENYCPSPPLARDLRLRRTGARLAQRGSTERLIARCAPAPAARASTLASARVTSHAAGE